MFIVYVIFFFNLFFFFLSEDFRLNVIVIFYGVITLSEMMFYLFGTWIKKFIEDYNTMKKEKKYIYILTVHIHVATQ